MTNLVSVLLSCIVYKSKGYIDVVSSCTYLSMKKAIDDVKSIPDYEEYGEVWTATNFTKSFCQCYIGFCSG